MGDTVVDLFAGPGGWDVGSVWAGHDGPLWGLEHDHDANLTATAAGFARVEADVAAYPPRAFGEVDGLIASPPCQAFSLAGKGAGRDAVPELLAHVRACADGWVDPPDRLCGDDVRADLTLQPLRWAWALRPRWVACEQVPPALPLWEETARVLEGWGYSTWAGKLSTEEYGVPQTRTRAFLIARRDGPAAGPPTPTHTAYDPRADDGGRTPQPSLFGPELRPWVSMAEALGWPSLEWSWERPDGEERHHSTDEPAPTVCGSRMPAWARADAVVRTGQHTYKHSRRPEDAVTWERPIGAPAPTVRANGPLTIHVNTGRDWKPGGDRSDAQTFDATERPAPTVDGKGRWHVEPGDEWTADRPATTVIGSSSGQVAAPGHRCMSDDCCGRGPRRHFDGDPVDWTGERPATTVAGDPRVHPPGHKVNGDDVRRLGEDEADARYDGRAGKRSVRVTLEQAARLQSFPDGYPWRGATKTSRFSQVGNAVPPLLAAAVLRPLLADG